ncbi:MAG: hypothetical protein ACO24P_06510, partial [Candidatus Nanopelagicaceae bacterium]
EAQTPEPKPRAPQPKPEAPQPKPEAQTPEPSVSSPSLDDLRQASAYATMTGPSKEAQALMSKRTKTILGQGKLQAGLQAQQDVEAMKSEVGSSDSATRQRSKAEEDGLRKWASIYGPGGKRELKMPTQGQKDLFAAVKSGSPLPQVRTIKQDVEDLKKKKTPSAPLPGGTPMGGPYNEAYDVVLDYLLSEGHAETVDEAHYVMMQMTPEHVKEVIQERAWWDPAGLFTKTAKEKALEKPSPGYDPKSGTSSRRDKKNVIVAPLTTGGKTRYVTQIPGNPNDPKVIASRRDASHASWKPDINRLNTAYPSVQAKSVVTALTQEKNARDAAAAADAAKLRRQPGTDPFAPVGSKTNPLSGRSPVASSGSSSSTPRPQPKSTAKPTASTAKPVAAAPTPPPVPVEPKLSKINQEILDLRQMRADSLSRQGRTADAQNLQTAIDVASADKKLPPYAPLGPDSPEKLLTPADGDAYVRRVQKLAGGSSSSIRNRVGMPASNQPLAPEPPKKSESILSQLDDLKKMKARREGETK